MIREFDEAKIYIESELGDKDIFLKELETYAKENKVPIVTKEVAEYLRFMAEYNKSKNILEIGTAIAYSGIILARAAEKNNGKLTTIEINEDSFNIAKSNFEKAGLSNVIQELGDAVVILDKLEEKYDFIFIDAAKGKYMDFFEKSYKLLEKDGIIFIDNILFRGYVYSEEFPKRYKTMVKKLKEFISYLYREHDFTLLPFGDGIGLVK